MRHVAWTVLALALAAGRGAVAHEMRPALLEIRHTDTSRCEILWKQPTSGEAALRLVPRLSAGWLDRVPDREFRGPAHHSLRWLQPQCTSSALEAQTLSVDGLDATLVDVFVRVGFEDGTTLQHILRPGDPPLALARSPDPASGGTPAAGHYLRLGVLHILEGIDHLAFVLALVLLVRLRARLIGAITGFTAAHSLTLGATALGLFEPWPALIEALVALSILFVAAEVVHRHRGASSLTIRRPELAALGFGLLHGFAFAGALADIGLPREETLFALLLFNLGVEAGQLLFIGAVLAVSLAARPLLVRLPHRAGALPAYGIGACAGFWFIERALVVLA